MATRKKRTIEQRLAEINEKKKALDAQRKALQARHAKKRRAEDTRRKILVGALLLHHLEAHPEARRLKTWLAKELPNFVRPRDLPLFADLLQDNQADSAADNPPTAGPPHHQT